MRAICFYFQVHQPFRLRNYRFFDIGVNHNYYDEFQNRHIARRVADKCYLPTNKVMLDIIREYGSSFKISYSISGTALDQFEMYTPEVIDSFRALADTGCVEFLAETYSHSLCALKSKDEFIRQVGLQAAKIEKLFGKKPVTFRNTELIYSDGIGEMVAEMGYKTQLTEGAKHVLGWKSPNYMYCNAINPKLKLLLKNFQMSDDIAFRFSQQSWNEWPLTAEKYVNWLNAVDQKQEVVNLFMDYETFGEHQWPETGIFEFLKVLPSLVLSSSNYSFHTPSELSDLLQPVSAFNAPYPISWADEERDLTAWLGNELQDDAFDKLYEIEHKIKNCNEETLQRDWKYLQTSDHFYYMCTKWFSDGDVHKYFNPYNTPYEAYINFMNILSDFLIRINERCPEMPFIQPQPEEVTLEKIAADELKATQEKETKKTTGTASKKTNSKKVPTVISFDQIADIQNTLLKKVIRELEPEVLALALRGTNTEIKEKFTYNFTVTYQKNYTAANKRISKPSAKEISTARKQIEELIAKHS
jgi:alpha-amylase